MASWFCHGCDGELFAFANRVEEQRAKRDGFLQCNRPNCGGHYKPGRSPLAKSNELLRRQVATLAKSNELLRRQVASIQYSTRSQLERALATGNPAELRRVAMAIVTSGELAEEVA